MPNKDSQELYNLIHSLTGGEKRFFKIQASQNASKGKNKCVSIYDDILKQKENNIDSIKKKYKNFAVLKHLLVEQILKSLRHYHEDKSPDIQLMKYLANIEILHAKGLLMECLKYINKGKKLALQHQKHMYLAAIIDMELNVAIAGDNFKAKKEYINNGYKKAVEYIKLQINFYEYTKFEFEFSLLQSKYRLLRNEEQQKEFCEIIESNPLFSDENNAKSHNAKLQLFLTKMSYYSILGEHNLVYKYNLLLIKQIKANWNNDFLHYVTALHNTAWTMINIRKFKQFDILLNKIIYYKSKLSSSEDNLLNNHLTTLQLYRYIYSGNFKEGINFLQKHEYIIKNISIDRSRININIISAIIRFGNNDYDKSLIAVEEILSSKIAKENFEVAYAFARILFLMIQFELGNHQVLESNINATYQYLSRKKNLFYLEKVMITFFKKSNNTISKKEQINLFAITRKDLIQKEKKAPYLLSIWHLDIIAWLDSKINNISISDAIKYRNKEKFNDDIYDNIENILAVPLGKGTSQSDKKP